MCIRDRDNIIEELDFKELAEKETDDTIKVMHEYFGSVEPVSYTHLGFIAGVAVSLVFLATTKTLSGDSYLYPLIPLNREALKRLIFRTEK